MREMKDSGIEWIGEIPCNWVVSKIKYLFDVISGSTPSSVEENWDGDITWITPADYNTKDKYVNMGKRNLSKMGYLSCSTYLVPLGTIVFSKRAPIGTVAITSKVLCTNQGCLSCIKKGRVSEEYYYYVLSIGTEHFELLGSGTIFKEISANNFLNCPIPFPSFEEQEKIVAFLKNKCFQIDELLWDLQRQIGILEQYKQSVITEVVTKGLNANVEMKDSGIEWVEAIPAHWNVHPVYYYFAERKKKNVQGKENNLLSLSYGRVIRKDINSNGGLLPENFNTYNIVEDRDIIIRPTDLQNDKRSLRTGLVKEHGIITSAYIDLMPIHHIDTRYFHYLFHSYDVMKVFYNMGNGVRQGLNFSEFSRLMIFEPSYQEQVLIADYLDEKNQKIDALIDTKKQQLIVMETYKQSIIYEYVTGKREVM